MLVAQIFVKRTAYRFVHNDKAMAVSVLILIFLSSSKRPTICCGLQYSFSFSLM
ncbi:hypothetical protein AZO1586I_322 [Bathymodiolus thermophilus thioautotrophic gill symbiont]|uniref:Uncharacterized protein n=1 Tax=Bathymodiolus thermophilus thioautotrophic gill symbiont TaxID=2360 RepID=A0ABN7G8G2_9GAMM|nr:hypothetical protein AZO1586I_322 [Bathymodiolus thermophilus thioautotrophic gill symbiont]